jgi:hypothetical protein
LNSNLLNEVVIQFTNYLKQAKINNFRDTRNIKNFIGRSQKISIFNIVSFAFKTINGSNIEDLVENLKEIFSYQKYIRKLKRCGILDENKLDVSDIHINSTDVLNLCGTENINYGHKFKNKKASRIYLSLSNNGIPLSVHLTGANKNDSTQLETNLNNIPFKIKTSNKNQWKKFDFF